jgi:hypothetical protein
MLFNLGSNYSLIILDNKILQKMYAGHKNNAGEQQAGNPCLKWSECPDHISKTLTETWPRNSSRNHKADF